jgi:hypothetical protein
MTKKQIFEIILLIARPAAGKSEIIDYLYKLNPSERVRRFHIGEIDVIDDFPMLWTWFEEDHILSEMGYPRLHTTENEIFIGHHLWDVLIERICLEYQKRLRDSTDYHQNFTTIIEFSRGKEHGGYNRAFDHLSQEILKKLAILYINVSWAEALRKNQARFNPNRPDSILEHSLSDEKMEFLYKEIDWEEVSASNPHYINIKGTNVPYAVFENEDDVTTDRGEELGLRLERTLDILWKLYTSNRSVLHP